MGNQAKTCTICGGKFLAQGLCNKHYLRWKKYGDPLVVKLDRSLTPEERFWSKVDKNGPVPRHRPELGQCWVWTAGKNDSGYGVFTLNGRQLRSHRVAYTWSGAELPADLELDHLCRTRACCRPDHLEPVTGAVNNYRSDSPWGINSRKTHCPKNHDYTPDNTYMYEGERHCRTCARERTREWIRRTGWKPKAQRKPKAA